MKLYIQRMVFENKKFDETFVIEGYSLRELCNKLPEGSDRWSIWACTTDDIRDCELYNHYDQGWKYRYNHDPLVIPA